MFHRQKKTRSQVLTEKTIAFYEEALAKQKKLMSLYGWNTTMNWYPYFKRHVKNEITRSSTLGEFLVEANKDDNHNHKRMLLYHLMSFILELKKQVIDIEIFSLGIKNLAKFYGPKKWKKMVTDHFHQSCFYTEGDKSMLLQSIDNNDDKEPSEVPTHKDTSTTGRRNAREVFRKGYSSNEDSSGDDVPSGRIMKALDRRFKREIVRKQATDFEEEDSSDEDSSDDEDPSGLLVKSIGLRIKRRMPRKQTTDLYEEESSDEDSSDGDAPSGLQMKSTGLFIKRRMARKQSTDLYEEDSSDDDAPSGLLMKSTGLKRATECGVFREEYSSDEEGKDTKSKTNDSGIEAELEQFAKIDLCEEDSLKRNVREDSNHDVVFSSETQAEDTNPDIDISGIEAELEKYAKIGLCEEDSPERNIREDSNPGIDFASKIEAEISEDSSLDSEVSSKIEAEISENANLDGGVPSETEENELTRDENMANIHRSQGFAHNSAAMASHNPHPHWSNNNPTAVAPHNPQAYAHHPQYLAQNSQPFSMPPNYNPADIAPHSLQAYAHHQQYLAQRSPLIPMPLNHNRAAFAPQNLQGYAQHSQYSLYPTGIPNSPMVASNYNPAGFQGYNQRANVATFGHNLAGRQGILLPVNPNAAWETICTITSSKKWPSPGEINAGLEQARVDTSHHANWANTKDRYHNFKHYECDTTKARIRVRKRKGDDGAFDGTFDIDTKGQVNFIQH